MRLAFRWLIIICIASGLSLFFLASRAFNGNTKPAASLENDGFAAFRVSGIPPTAPKQMQKRREASHPVNGKRVLRIGKRPVTLNQELRRRKTLFVGVVTAKNLLETRARAIYDTWGKELQKMHFFSSEDSTSADLPVIGLPGVDDTYPPQKKVFTMLKYIHDHFIDEFDWFLRSDDDLYVRPDVLVPFLDTIDSSQMIYMGQPGFGRQEDRKRLKLEDGEVYCMGGPGVFYSRSLLKELRPHIDDCLKNVVVSYNEDVEVGRCVSRKVGRQCTWSYELEHHFFNDFSKKMFTDDKLSALRQHKFAKDAATLHPIKIPQMMRVVHQFFQDYKVERLEREKKRIEKEVEMWKQTQK